MHTVDRRALIRRAARYVSAEPVGDTWTITRLPVTASGQTMRLERLHWCRALQVRCDALASVALELLGYQGCELVDDALLQAHAAGILQPGEMLGYALSWIRRAERDAA